jgi:hypothetical protein
VDFKYRPVFCKKVGCWRSAPKAEDLACARCKPPPEPAPEQAKFEPLDENHWYDMVFGGRV